MSNWFLHYSSIAVSLVAAYFAGHAGARSHHHRVMSRGFHLLACVLRSGRDVETDDVVAAFGPTSWVDAKGWKPPREPFSEKQWHEGS